MNKEYNCPMCKDEGHYEVDPIRPEQANTPQYEICECKIREAETMDEIIDDTVDE